MKIAVAGCVAQAEGEEIIRRERSGRSRGRAAELSPAAGDAGARRRTARCIDTEFPVEDKFDHLAAPSRAAIRKRGVSAFITVQEGCDKFCTFCVVPYTRGAEVSRPVAKIVAEAERLADAGVREITLLGQNVNAYHGEDADGRAATLGRLMHRLAEIPGIARLRYTTSHPRDMDDSLIAAHRDLPALMPQLHLPVQSGSDRILEAMNRRHTRADYLRVIERLRAARPDIAFSSDFIVGFPGETDDDFQDTHAAGRRGRLRQRLLVQIFAAARHARRRHGSGAGGREGRAAATAAGRHRAAAGRVHGALRRHDVRRAVRQDPAAIPARSSAARLICSRCRSSAPTSLIGEIAPVTVTEVRTNSLFGTLANARTSAASPLARDAGA